MSLTARAPAHSRPQEGASVSRAVLAEGALCVISVPRTFWTLGNLGEGFLLSWEVGDSRWGTVPPTFTFQGRLSVEGLSWGQGGLALSMPAPDTWLQASAGSS